MAISFNPSHNVNFSYPTNSVTPPKQEVPQHETEVRSKDKSAIDARNAQDNFNQISQRKTRSVNTPSESSQPVIHMQGGGALHQYYLIYGNLWGYLPPEKPPVRQKVADQDDSADGLTLTLDEYEQEHKYEEGDYKLSQTVSKHMLKHDPATDSQPMIDVNQNTTIRGWLDQLRNAFSSNILKKWYETNEITPGSLSYDSKYQNVQFVRNDGRTLSMSLEQFYERYPTARQGLEPVIDACKKLAPEGSDVAFTAWPQGKAPLDVIQNFYGIKPPETKEASTAWGKELQKIKAFPEHTLNLPENDWALSRQQRRLQNINEGFVTQPKYVVEYESSADQLHRDLNAWPLKHKNPADYKLSQSIGDIMSTMTEDAFTKPLPEITVEKGTSFYRWIGVINQAFENKALTEWAKKNNAREFSFDPETRTFHATVGNESKSYTADEFDKQFPAYSGALDPLNDVAKVVAPFQTGIKLRPIKDDKVPVDMLLSFYGLKSMREILVETHEDVKAQANSIIDENHRNTAVSNIDSTAQKEAIEKINRMGTQLKNNDSVFSQEPSWRREDETYEHSLRVIEITNSEYGKPNKRMVIEYSGRDSEIIYA
ncbi:hypothetical protein MYA83_29905 [Pseudomonas palleroniana]|uniref:hypothetical protein n=1 Tax=Pseudomonas palleroniana TaxID=191390 RepID=UPI003AFF7B84